MHQALVRGRARFRLRRARARTCQRRHQERAAQRFPPRRRIGACLPRLQGLDHRAVQGLELSRQAHAGIGSRAAQAWARGLGGERSQGNVRLLYARARLPGIRLDR